MVSLETYLNSVNFSTQLEDVKNILNKAETRVTFWGTRVVEVKGYAGSVNLERIAQRLLEASWQRCEADDLTLVERVAGIDIDKRVKNFYLITDTQIQNANLLTKLLRWIREFYFIPYNNPRFYYTLMMNASVTDVAAYFRAYSEPKFIQQFGKGFNKRDPHRGSGMSFGPPSRRVACEVCIREKLTARWFWFW